MTTPPPDMSLRQFVRQRRYFLAAALSWVIMVMLTFSVLVPQLQEITYVRERHDTETKALAQLRNKVQFLASFDVDAFKKQNERMNTVLPSSKPFLPLLFSLKQLAQEKDVIFSGLEWSIGLVASDSAEPKADAQVAPKGKQAQEAGNTESLAKMSLELKVLGTTEKLNGYFDAMTRITPVVEIDDVALAPKFQIQVGLYEASLKLSSFYAPLTSLRSVVLGDRPLPQLSEKEKGYVQRLTEYTVYMEDTADVQDATSSGRENIFAF